LIRLAADGTSALLHRKPPYRRLLNGSLDSACSIAWAWHPTFLQ
jgi:hypothetical protein